MRKALAFSFILLAATTAGSATILGVEFDSANPVCNPMVSWVNPFCTPQLSVDLEDNADLHGSIYNQAQFTDDQRNRTATEIKTHLDQSYGIGMAEAKQEAMIALKNGSKETGALVDGQESVNDLYAELQRKAYVYKNREVLKVNQSLASIESDGTLTVNDVYSIPNSQYSIEDCSGYYAEMSLTDFGELRTFSENITLWNGEEFESFGLKLVNATWEGDSGGTSGGPCTREYTGNIIEADLSTDSGGNPVSNSDKLLTKSPFDSNVTPMVAEKPYRDAADGIRDTRDRAFNNVNQIVSSIYDNYDAESLKNTSVSDLMGPLELLKTSATNYESTGLYSYAAVSLAQQGLASNQSYAFRVNWTQEDSSDWKVATGQLFADKDSFDTIEVGKMYNATNKGVYFAYQPESGKAETIQITGEFEVLNMTDKSTGEQVNSTSIQQTKFYTTNTSKLQSQLKKLRKQIEQLQTSSGGGIGAVGGWIDDIMSSVAETLGIPQNWVTAIAVGLLVTVVALGAGMRGGGN